MPTKTELEAEVWRLKQEVRDLQQNNTLFVRKEREPEVYVYGETNVVEWVDRVTVYIDRYHNVREQVQVILQYLDRQSKTEVLFHLDIKTCSPKDVFDIILGFGKPVNNAIQLQQQFFTRDQHEGESESSYMHALMDIALDIRDLDDTCFPDFQEMVKMKYADGVQDCSLKHEMK